MRLFLTFLLTDTDEFLIRCSPIEKKFEELNDSERTFIFNWDGKSDIPTDVDMLSKSDWEYHTGIFHTSNYKELALFTDEHNQEFIITDEGMIRKPDDYKEFTLIYLNGELIELQE